MPIRLAIMIGGWGNESVWAGSLMRNALKKIYRRSAPRGPLGQNGMLNA